MDLCQLHLEAQVSRDCYTFQCYSVCQAKDMRQLFLIESCGSSQVAETQMTSDDVTSTAYSKNVGTPSDYDTCANVGTPSCYHGYDICANVVTPYVA